MREKKKILFLLICLMLCIGLLAISGLADSDSKTSGDYTYKLVETTDGYSVTITGYTGSAALRNPHCPTARKDRFH